MHRSSDGFKISEEDLRLRGPGDFFGSRQHGLPEMHVADLGADVNVLQTAQQEAQLLLASDPDLSRPEHRALKKRIDLLFEQSDASFN
jgi:ATP-dependent DNA helicase RecG